jgi:hypothetical protein
MKSSNHPGSLPLPSGGLSRLIGRVLIVTAILDLDVDGAGHEHDRRMRPNAGSNMSAAISMATAW